MSDTDKRRRLEERTNLELLKQLSRRNQQLKLAKTRLSSMDERLAEYQREQEQLRSLITTSQTARPWKAVNASHTMRRWVTTPLKAANTVPFRRLLAIYQALIPGNYRAAIRRFLGIDSQRPLKYEPHKQFEEVRGTLVELSDIPDRKEFRARHDYLILSIIEMEARFQRPQQMAVHLASQGHRVFYVSSSKFFSPNDSEPYRIREITPRLFEVALPAHKQPRIYEEIVDSETQEIFVTAIRSLAEEYSIYTAIQFVQIPFWTELVIELRELFGWTVVYDCMDEWEDFPGIKPEILDSVI